ncbi:MAG TPA: PucR family transcriptional regulator [Clostridia bacterium]|nr:PucR family transcriptional regulator [Clostridia bacterium]
MKLYVQDIYNFPELSKLTLIAGEGGLKKEVKHCGILDYEYDKDVASKYSDYNYRTGGGFLTLTSFLYAKDNPDLIYEAVKKLVAKNGSGLIIKNIFKLPITHNVIRYADYMQFPIFVLNDSYPFFEDIILLIYKKMEQYESFNYMEQKVNALLKTDETDLNMVASLAYEINPSMQDDIVVAYFSSKEGLLTHEMSLEEESKLYKAELIKPEDAVFFYRDGLMLIHSTHNYGSNNLIDLLRPYIEAIGEDVFKKFNVGISKVHHAKDELPEAIKESVYAAMFNETSIEYKTFDALGVYRAILPFASTTTMKNYQQDYISPLEEYDAGRSGDILNTVVEFVKCGGNLEITAAKMKQHKNTIRYRLRVAGNILNINPFSLGDYEKIALAIRIYICSNSVVLPQ